MEINIKENTEIRDILTGNICITNSSEFSLSGIVNGNVKIEKDSSAIIYGTVNGNIISFGDCKVYGVVNGNVSGNIQIDSNAIINSK